MLTSPITRITKLRQRRGLSVLADEDLVQLAQKGDLQAFELIYERHSRSAYSLAARMVGAGPAAEEVTQEAFLSVWRAIERYDATQAGVRTWLMRIVHSRAIDALRAQSVHSARRADLDGFEVEFDSGQTPLESVVEQRDDAEHMRSALHLLPEDQRAVIELAYFGGFTHHEIAEMVSAPLGTVKGRMRLGFEKLRTDLDRQIPEMQTDRMASITARKRRQ